MTRRQKLIEEIMADFHAMENKMHSRVMRGAQKEWITHSQLFVLVIIKEHRDIGIKEISRRLHISSPAATQLVDGLVENGYVVRSVSEKDRRALQLKLSKKGQRHITELKNKHIKILTTLFDALDDNDLEIYLRLHKKILINL